MEPDSSKFLRRLGRTAFLTCARFLPRPTLLPRTVRGIVATAQCGRGVAICRGLPLGGAFRDALALAWALGTNTWLLLGIAIAAAIAPMFMRRPILGASAMLFGPLLALMLPMAAVYSTAHPGCAISEAGECVLWGAPMGDSMHAAAAVPGVVYGFAPLSFALALMLGVLGWFIARR